MYNYIYIYIYIYIDIDIDIGLKKPRALLADSIYGSNTTCTPMHHRTLSRYPRAHASWRGYSESNTLPNEQLVVIENKQQRCCVTNALYPACTFTCLLKGAELALVWAHYRLVSPCLRTIPAAEKVRAQGDGAGCQSLVQLLPWRGRTIERERASERERDAPPH